MSSLNPTVTFLVPPGSPSSFSLAPSGDGLGTAGVNNFDWASCGARMRTC